MFVIAISFSDLWVLPMNHLWCTVLCLLRFLDSDHLFVRMKQTFQNIPEATFQKNTETKFQSIPETNVQSIPETNFQRHPWYKISPKIFLPSHFWPRGPCDRQLRRSWSATHRSTPGFRRAVKMHHRCGKGGWWLGCAMNILLSMKCGSWFFLGKYTIWWQTFWLPIWSCKIPVCWLGEFGNSWTFFMSLQSLYRRLHLGM